MPVRQACRCLLGSQPSRLHCLLQRSNPATRGAPCVPLPGWHSALQSAAADGPQPFAEECQRVLDTVATALQLLVPSIAWALEPEHLGLLGLADGELACRPPL